MSFEIQENILWDTHWIVFNISWYWSGIFDIIDITWSAWSRRKSGRTDLNLCNCMINNRINIFDHELFIGHFIAGIYACQSDIVFTWISISVFDLTDTKSCDRIQKWVIEILLIDFNPHFFWSCQWNLFYFCTLKVYQDFISIGFYTFDETVSYTNFKVISINTRNFESFNYSTISQSE